MLKKGFLKPNLTFEKIGKKQFWFGLVIGLLFAFLINHFFILSREALRSITFMGDPLILSYKEFRFYDLFFASFSSSLGFGITIICWLFVPDRKNRRSYLRTFTVSSSFLITFMALAIVSRFGSVLPIILYGLRGYDNHLSFLKEFSLLLFLIPIYVFFANWNSIRLLYKANNWVLASSVLFLINTIFLFKITYADRDLLNQTYYNNNKERFAYIDNEIETAKDLGIIISDSTKLVLQKRYAERTTDLVTQVKTAFKRREAVSVDTLLLEKIVIHNLNQQAITWHKPIDSTERNWSYALPEEIYSQILMHDVNSLATKILFEILFEQISIFTVDEVDWHNYKDYSTYEREKYNFKRNTLWNTSTIQSRLKQVIEKLNSDPKYEDYYHFISDFEFTGNRFQEEYKIDFSGVGKFQMDRFSKSN